ncbi:MAG: hypothetical protein L6435_11450 [Anaerolineae bacterium]|nr:hypothetical protein [Anaerolineae bacterium]
MPRFYHRYYPDTKTRSFIPEGPGDASDVLAILATVGSLKTAGQAPSRIEAMRWSEFCPHEETCFWNVGTCLRVTDCEALMVRYAHFRNLQRFIPAVRGTGFPLTPTRASA